MPVFDMLKNVEANGDALQIRDLKNLFMKLFAFLDQECNAKAVETFLLAIRIRRDYPDAEEIHPFNLVLAVLFEDRQITAVAHIGIANATMLTSIAVPKRLRHKHRALDLLTSIKAHFDSKDFSLPAAVRSDLIGLFTKSGFIDSLQINTDKSHLMHSQKEMPMPKEVDMYNFLGLTNIKYACNFALALNSNFNCE